jgi:hypothetical protein
MTYPRLMPVLAVLAALLAPSAESAARAEERHAGYYYPETQTSEVYDARVDALPGSDRLRRIGFVTVLTNEMLKNPYPPQFAIFAKGADAEKLIVTSVAENSYKRSIARGPCSR